jgi:hypothetical protein
VKSVYSTNSKERSEVKSVYSTNLKTRSGANSSYSRNKIEEQKNELDLYKTNRGSIFKTFMEPRNQFQGIDPPAYALAGQSQYFLTNRGSIFKTFMEPRNQFQGIDSASPCPGGPEHVFFNVYGAQESIPRNEFRQPM